MIRSPHAQLAWLSLAMFLGMTLWFSATAGSDTVSDPGSDTVSDPASDRDTLLDAVPDRDTTPGYC